jgi:adenylyltransferase/sulfurtransferase
MLLPSSYDKSNTIIGRTTLKTSSIILTLIMALTLFAGCSPPVQKPEGMEPVSPADTMAKASYTDLTPQEAKKLIDDNPGMVVIVDVSPYYTNGHLPGAIHLQLGKLLDMAIPTLDNSKKYLVYCHGDAPSIAGAQKLVDAGFKMVYRLKGNYGAWVEAGYPVEK